MGILGRGFSKLALQCTYKQKICALLRPRNGYKLINEARLLRRFMGKQHLLQPMSEFCIQNCYTSNEIMVELAPHGSLMDLFDALEFDGKLDVITSRHIDVILEQVERGLDELQTLGLEHNDLNARNILVFNFDEDVPEKMKIKLCDFSETRIGNRDCTRELRREIEMLSS
jgi:serine/threonine protein kinase